MNKLLFELKEIEGAYFSQKNEIDLHVI